MEKRKSARARLRRIIRGSFRCVLTEGLLVPLEILDLFFVLFCSFHTAECAQVAALLRFWIGFAGIKPVFPGF